MLKATQADEQRLHNVVVDAVKSAKAGDHPTQAIYKAAKEHRLPPNHVLLAVHAYNTGRTNEQRGVEGDHITKSSSFPMADGEKVMALLYPKTKPTKQASDDLADEYDHDPVWADDVGHTEWTEKSAAEAAQEMGFFSPEPAKDIYGRVPKVRTQESKDRSVKSAMQKFERGREEVAEKASRAFDNFDAAFAGLVDYWKTANAVDFDRAAEDAEAFFGKSAAVVAERLKPSIRKSARPYTKFDIRVMPGKGFKNAIDFASQYKAAMENVEAYEREGCRIILNLNQWASGRPKEAMPADTNISIVKRSDGIRRNELIAKEAGAMDPVATGLQLGFGNNMAQSIIKKISPGTEQSAVDRTYDKITDPEHENRLRGIRAQSVLHAVMSSPYFAKEDPRHVADLFNRVSSIAPRASEQPVLMESLMRRYSAQGSVDPYELQQLLQLETGLKKRDLPDRPATVSLGDKE